MGYANYQQLLNDIQTKFLNNNTRLITEPVMRQVQSDIADFFNRRIIDYYNRQEADDANYTVNTAAEPSTSLVNIVDSVILLPVATAPRQVILPTNVLAGNHVLIFVKDSPVPAIDAGRFYWNTSVLMEDQYADPHKDLKPGWNFLLWNENSGTPILMYMGWDSRLNAITIPTAISLESITSTYLDETFGMVKIGQQIIFDNLTDAPSNVAVVFKTASGWAMNTAANKIV